ncbi:sodium-dependent transporter [Gordonibacter sp. Marseille-P4307]|uniref:sodium-dependent transporter n=1 Tax=Gordonibacter sp. Marseille-P4307 TaxID=2161815 RepID=UPI0019D2F220|nr:sodium-dependent transporter [Gordonibacter sp. Marseille-P4307]
MDAQSEKRASKRDSFISKRGFILACIGSAVGMGNIWLFPTRVSAYGGATFIIPYLLFVVLIASTGIIEEMSFGRAAKGGPVAAFANTTKKRFGTSRVGAALGLVPVATSLAMAIGYSVVVGWIFKYTFDSLTGGAANVQGAEQFAAQFGSVASGNALWQTIGMLAAIGILVFGVSKGIEKANKVMMPLFFCLFVGLAVYVATLPGSIEGYRYIFLLDPAGLADPIVWVYALGQAFFSLSIAGSGTLIYGSYLSDAEDVPNSAKYVALFDTIAAVVASLVIIPAMAFAGQQLSQGGPGLLFIYLPNLFSTMPGGALFMAVFFVAVLFGGLTSLINLFEAPIATLEEMLGVGRRTACLAIGGIGLVVGIAIQGIVSSWMDVCSVYLCPIGACLAAIMFFWLSDREWVLEQVNKGRSKPLGSWFYPLAKYVFVGVSVLVLVLGSVLGGIG